MATVKAGYAFDSTEEVTATKLSYLASSSGPDPMTVTDIATADIADGAITNDKITDVSGAKFTNLSQITVGAGVIPAANVPAVSASITGEIRMYGGTSAPSGWLACNGASVLIADYNALYAVIGITYGQVDGTHFTLPDFVGKVPRGSATPGTGSGADTVTIAETNLPAHSHASGTLAAANESSHTHTVPLYGGGGSGSYGIVRAGISGGVTQNEATSAGSAHGHTISGSTGAIGSGTALSVIPKHDLVMFIIKT